MNFGQCQSATQALCRAGKSSCGITRSSRQSAYYIYDRHNERRYIRQLSIAEHAECEIDLRSTDNETLYSLVDSVLPLFSEGAELENQRWGALLKRS